MKIRVREGDGRSQERGSDSKYLNFNKRGVEGSEKSIELAKMSNRKTRHGASGSKSRRDIEDGSSIAYPEDIEVQRKKDSSSKSRKQNGKLSRRDKRSSKNEETAGEPEANQGGCIQQ